MLPGEFIGTEEEYLEGNGTYLEDGKLYASVAGDLHVDSKHRATIIAKDKIPDMRVGATVYGKVDEVFESKAFVTLEFSEISRKKKTIKMQGIIQVSEIKNEYVRVLRDELKVGDIIKGKVIDVTPFNVIISFKNRGLGVIKAFCSKCRQELSLKGNILECGNCGNKENRTLGFPYGTV